jgi:hypothetical protein
MEARREEMEREAFERGMANGVKDFDWRITRVRIFFFYISICLFFFNRHAPRSIVI